jgi:hypothetical protein
LFGANAGGVAGHAKRDGWAKQRKMLRMPLEQKIDNQIQSMARATKGENMQKSEPKQEISAGQSNVVIPAEERIKALRPKQDLFRERVAAQTNRVLDHLEQQELLTNMQADQFITILEKTEKVGARARGMDKDDEKSSRVLINLAVLNGAASLGETSTLVHESGYTP